MSDRIELCGVVVVNKPSGPTSFDVVRRVKGLFKVKRVGHNWLHHCDGPLQQLILYNPIQ